MASFNNRHWPSMFRAKHAAAHPWQPQPDTSGWSPSLVSGGSTTTTRSSIKHSFLGGEERAPDPKPRWNPRPEQIRILEAIFNSGMVNPPRDEIPRIRMRLQEYAPVSDANVFYWFQNRKARSKNKLLRSARAVAPAARAPPARLHAAPLATSPQQIQTQQVQLLASSPAQQAPTSSSSSSSDRSSGSSRPAAAKKPAVQTMFATEAVDLLGPLAAACPQAYYQGQPVAPATAPSPDSQQKDHVAADETIFLPWPQGHCMSASELAAILGSQYMHVPAVQPQPPALPATPSLGICNEVAEPTTFNGHRNCTGWASGLGLYWPSSGSADDHQVCKNTAALNITAAKEVASHEGAEKPALPQYDSGASTAMDAAAAVSLPLSASPDAAVAVASVAASTAGLTDLTATTASNAVVTNYDQLFQGLTDGVDAGVTGEPVAAAAAPPTANPDEDGVAVLCIGDSATGTSVVREVAARHLDVRAQFGEAAVLFRFVSDGERPVHVPLDAASGYTVEPLQHGVVYWVLV